jgi:sec-independent protein translocase protein TatB
MFDVGFSEIVVIAVVALVVIGPEKLPKTARTLGVLFGRLQRYVGEVKADINREMELDELRKLQSEMQGAARDLEQTVASAASGVATGVQNLERELSGASTEVLAAAPAETSSVAPPAPVPAGEARAADLGAPGVTATATTAAQPAPSRQAALPGFEKI